MNRIGIAGLFTALLWLVLATASSASQPGIACVQNQLNALGFDAGPADGSIGKKTRAAAEEYRAWMENGAGGAGWSQPPLTALNGVFWCERVADAHPDVAKFFSDQPLASPLAGTWRLDIRCPEFSFVNTVRIKSANEEIILGTTNVNDGYGAIVSGYVNGRDFTFTNTFLYEGKSEFEIWKGRLSQSGRLVSGSFESSRIPGTCQFSGPHS